MMQRDAKWALGLLLVGAVFLPGCRSARRAPPSPPPPVARSMPAAMQEAVAAPEAAPPGVPSDALLGQVACVTTWYVAGELFSNEERPGPEVRQEAKTGPPYQKVFCDPEGRRTDLRQFDKDFYQFGESYQYDNAARLRRKVALLRKSMKGDVVEVCRDYGYIYDDDGRLKRVQAQSFVCDNATSVVDDMTTTTYTYLGGNLETEAEYVGDGGDGEGLFYRKRYASREGGPSSSERFNDEDSLQSRDSYVYDDKGRLKSVERTREDVVDREGNKKRSTAEYAYDKGRLATAVYHNEGPCSKGRCALIYEYQNGPVCCVCEKPVALCVGCGVTKGVADPAKCF